MFNIKKTSSLTYPDTFPYPKSSHLAQNSLYVTACSKSLDINHDSHAKLDANTEQPYSFEDSLEIALKPLIYFSDFEIDERLIFDCINKAFTMTKTYLRKNFADLKMHEIVKMNSNYLARIISAHEKEISSQKSPLNLIIHIRRLSWQQARTYLKAIQHAETSLIRLKKTIQKENIPYLSELPEEHLWELFIDADRCPRNRYEFDIDEPGYLGSLFDSLNYALQYKGPLTPEFIATLHDLAIKDVKFERKQSLGYMETEHREYGNCNNALYIKDDAMTELGLQELEEKIMGTHTNTFSNQLHKWVTLVRNKGQFLKDWKKHTLNRDAQSIASSNIMYHPHFLAIKETTHEKERTISAVKLILSIEKKWKDTPELTAGIFFFGDTFDRYKQANRLICAYQEESKLTTSTEEKQIAILRFIQNLDQSHLFADGNIRTVAFVLMNYLLVKENLCPVIWENPNVLDGHALIECYQLMLEGQSRFQSKLRRGIQDHEDLNNTLSRRLIS